MLRCSRLTTVTRSIRAIRLQTNHRASFNVRLFATNSGTSPTTKQSIVKIQPANNKDQKPIVTTITSSTTAPSTNSSQPTKSTVTSNAPSTRPILKSSSSKPSSTPTPSTNSSAASSFSSTSADIALSLETGLGSSLRHLLTAAQRVLLLDIKQHLAQMRATLKSSVYLTSEDSRWLKIAIQSSEELFLVVVVGEFNSGKSNLLNALLGSGEVCPTGVLPTTEHINILRYGKEKEIVRESENVVSVLLPLSFLKETSFVDTPGTNAVLRSHELITQNFIPRADLILFLTSVDRPFSESERVFMKNINKWKKKVAVVLNKVDLLKTPSDREKIIKFVKDHAASVLQDEKEIVLFPISAEKAVQAKAQLSAPSTPASSTAAAQQQLVESGLPALETYIFSTLTSQQKIFMKLNNPLGIGERVLAKYMDQIEKREEEWAEVDQQLLQRLKHQREEFELQSDKDFKLQELKLKQVFERLKKDSDQFIDDKLRLTNAREILFGDSLKNAYEQQIFKSLPSEVESIFSLMFDYLSETSSKTTATMSDAIRQRFMELKLQNTKLSRAHSRALEEASLEDQGSITTQVAATSSSKEPGAHGAFVHLQKESVPLTSPSEQLGASLVNEARSGVMQTVMLDLASLSLGTAFALNSISVLALAGTAGYFAVGGFVTFGIAGMYSLTYIRHRLARQLREKIDLSSKSLTLLFERTVAGQREQTLRLMDQTLLRRYERYVLAEGAEIETSRRAMSGLKLQLDGLKERIKEVTEVKNEEELGREKSTVIGLGELIESQTTPSDQTTPTTTSTTTTTT